MKNSITLYLLICSIFVVCPGKIFGQDQPPVVTASGDQLYCPGTSLNIVESFNITDPDDTGTTAIYIQISSGYVNGQDQLSLATPIPNVTTTWNATSAKLVISGVGGQELPYTTLITAVNNVVYTSSSANPTGTRTFSITVGDANYLPSTGHYYKFIPQAGISWSSAKTAAEASTYYGIQGYLATLLSADEAQLCGEQSSGNGWIGGSDSQTEGVWRWMTGPEAGTVFWNGMANGSTPNYAKWNTGEPNDTGGNEDYAHITAPGLGIAGSWNDLPNVGGTGQYASQGFIAEYGGMPGDPVLQISGSTTISMPTVTGTTPASRCGGGTLTLSAVVSAGTPHWYSSATGGVLLGTGNSFTTPNITSTATYYVSAYDETCTTVTRVPVVATINQIPVPVVWVNITTCYNTPAELHANSPDGTMHWYTQASGGTEVGTGEIFYTPALTADTVYYVEAVSPLGCISVRIAVNITVTPLPLVTAANSNPQALCGSGTATLQATPSAGIINWYDAATGGTLVATGTSFTTPNLTATTTYYAQAEDGTCVSASRQAVTVTVNPLPTAANVVNGFVCEQGTATLTVTPDVPSTVYWYDATTGGTQLGTGNDFTTPVLTSDAVYYAEIISAEGCISAQRTAVTVTVSIPPSVTSVVSPAGYCEGTPVLLEATATANDIYWYDQPTGGQVVATGSQVSFLNTDNYTTLYAGAVNQSGGGSTCESGIRLPVQLIAYALPDLGPDEAFEFCENTTLTLDAGLTGVTYLWDSQQTTQTVEVTQPGEYVVEVTNANGCTDTKTFTVSMIQAPLIADVVFTNTTATIIMVNQDLENYEYSIDGQNYQDAPLFANLAAGQYTAYARSLIGCGEDTKSFVIYLIPKVFSPNGDNVNDVFTIAGMSALPRANVYILDRYGMLITQLNRSNRSWDGTYNGYPLPATDYWYVIKLDDATPEIKGHFALVR